VELILKDGTRKPACFKCHRVNVVMRLDSICDECARIVGVPAAGQQCRFLLGREQRQCAASSEATCREATVIRPCLHFAVT
jgi:hypothetical protein